MPISVVHGGLVASSPRTEAAIATALELTPDELWAGARRAATYGYRQFVLGESGKRRVICAPQTWLKRIQSALYERVLLGVRVSNRVFSHRGHDVVENAEQHLGHSHMVVLDIENCFPSTRHST